MTWFRCTGDGGTPTPTPTFESYIYNVGKVGFNTGYKLKTTTKIRMKASIDAISGGWRSIFGYEQGGWRTNAMALTTGDSTQFAYLTKNAWIQGDVWSASESSTNANWSNIPCIFEATGNTISWHREGDSNTVRSLTTSGTVEDAVGTMGIFIENLSGDVDGWSVSQNSAYMRLFWFEIYEGNTLLHRFVPAYNNSQWCLYDEVDEVYIYDTIDNGSMLRGWLAS